MEEILKDMKLGQIRCKKKENFNDLINFKIYLGEIQLLTVKNYRLEL